MNQKFSSQTGKRRHVSKNTITLNRLTRGGAATSHIAERVVKLEDKEVTKAQYSRKATFWDKLSRFFGGKK